MTMSLRVFLEEKTTFASMSVVFSFLCYCFFEVILWGLVLAPIHGLHALFQGKYATSKLLTDVQARLMSQERRTFCRCIKQLNSCVCESTQRLRISKLG